MSVRNGGLMEELNSNWRLVALGVAHELRGSLQIITTSAFTAKQGSDPKALARIEKYAHRAQRIVEDLLALVATDLHRERTSLHDIQTAARDDIAATVKWEDPTAGGVLRVHPGLFARVLHVLYENAALANESVVTI